MLMTGFPLTGALGLMMPYLPAPVMEALAFVLLVRRSCCGVCMHASGCTLAAAGNACISIALHGPSHGT
jgi:hypothetical protein